MFTTRRTSIFAVSLSIGIAIGLGLGARPARAEAPAIAVIETRIASGLAGGGGSGQATWRTSPTTLGLLLAVAVQDEPRISALGGLLVEGFDRAALGANLGARVTTRGGRTRLAGGITTMLTPYTLGGLFASMGRCGKGGSWRLCVDLEVDVFALGDDLPTGAVAGQFMLALGLGFDVW